MTFTTGRVMSGLSAVTPRKMSNAPMPSDDNRCAVELMSPKRLPRNTSRPSTVATMPITRRRRIRSAYSE